MITMSQDTFTVLLNKIQQQLSELEIIAEFDSNQTTFPLEILKEDIKKALVTRDLIQLQNIWDKYFNNKIESSDDDDFM